MSKIKLALPKAKIYKNYNGDFSSTKQIIVTQKGIYKKMAVNSMCYVIKKVNRVDIGLDLNTVVYDKEVDTDLDLSEGVVLSKKIPVGIIDTVLSFYRVYAQSGNEVKLNIWYDTVLDKYIVDCPFQVVTPVSVREWLVESNDIIWTDELKTKFADKFKFKNSILSERRYILVLDTHSHHNMGCSFSGVDDANDYYNAVGIGLYGVYRNVGSLTPSLDLRYFVKSDNNNGPKSHATLKRDEVRFSAEQIIDFQSTEKFEYDFNEFSKHVLASPSEILGGPSDVI